MLPVTCVRFLYRGDGSHPMAGPVPDCGPVALPQLQRNPAVHRRVERGDPGPQAQPGVGAVL